jgi:hypothetical protein
MSDQEILPLSDIIGGRDATATISSCGLYRYDLWRRWNNTPYCMFIGLNPSTADAQQDDPTIRRCIAFTKKWGYGSLCMVNLFAFRATNPKDMMMAKDPVGPDNDRCLKVLSRGAGIVIAAWGKNGSHMGRAKQVSMVIPFLYCLHKNNDGSPSHPLYLPADSEPFPFS